MCSFFVNENVRKTPKTEIPCISLHHVWNPVNWSGLTLGLQNLGIIWTLFDGSGRDWRDLGTWTGPGSVFCVAANLQWQAVSTRRSGEAAGGRFLISDKCHCCHCTSGSCRHVSAEGRHISDVRCSCMQNTTFGTYLDSQSGQNDDSSRRTMCCQMPQKVPYILPILLFFGHASIFKFGAVKMEVDCSVLFLTQPAKVSHGGAKQRRQEIICLI